MAADTANSAGYRPPIQPTQKKDLQLEYWYLFSLKYLCYLVCYKVTLFFRQKLLKTFNYTSLEKKIQVTLTAVNMPLHITRITNGKPDFNLITKTFKKQEGPKGPRSLTWEDH